MNSGAANIRAHEDATQEEVYASYTEDQQTELDQMKANAQIYRDLTKSIAPQVYGHDDVKRAVLLMLFGGVHKETEEVVTLLLSFSWCHGSRTLCRQNHCWNILLASPLIHTINSVCRVSSCEGISMSLL